MLKIIQGYLIFPPRTIRTWQCLSLKLIASLRLILAGHEPEVFSKQGWPPKAYRHQELFHGKSTGSGRVDKDRTRKKQEMWPLYETTGSPSMCVAVTCVLKGTKCVEAACMQAKTCENSTSFAHLLHATCMYK